MKKIFNPIAYFDEKPLLAVGILSVLFNIIAGKALGFKMLSIGKFVDSSASLTQLAFAVLFAYGIAILFYYIFGYLINTKTRWIDIVNTVLMAAIPMIFATLISFIPYFREPLEAIVQMSPMDIEIEQITPVMIMGFVTLPLIIWSIVLLYKGFKTSTNMRLWWENLLFIIIYIAVTLIPQII